MRNKKMLDPENWDKISLSTYKEVYQEAKLRYDDLLSESESITNKSSKLTILIFGLAGWASTLFATGNYYFLIPFYCIPFIYLLWSLIKLSFPKKIIFKGTSPKVIFGDEKDLIDKNDTEEQKEKTFFYHQLKRYDDRIENIRMLNKKRGHDFKISLVISFGLVIAITTLFFYNHSALLVHPSSSSEVVVFPGPDK